MHELGLVGVLVGALARLHGDVEGLVAQDSSGDGHEFVAGIGGLSADDFYVVEVVKGAEALAGRFGADGAHGVHDAREDIGVTDVCRREAGNSGDAEESPSRGVVGKDDKLAYAEGWPATAEPAFGVGDVDDGGVFFDVVSFGPKRGGEQEEEQDREQGETSHRGLRLRAFLKDGEDFF